MAWPLCETPENHTEASVERTEGKKCPHFTAETPPDPPVAGCMGRLRSVHSEAYYSAMKNKNRAMNLVWSSAPPPRSPQSPPGTISEHRWVWAQTHPKQEASRERTSDGSGRGAGSGRGHWRRKVCMEAPPPPSSQTPRPLPRAPSRLHEFQGRLGFHGWIGGARPQEACSVEFLEPVAPLPGRCLPAMTGANSATEFSAASPLHTLGRQGQFLWAALRRRLAGHGHCQV